jgi:hypothetical protein
MQSAHPLRSRHVSRFQTVLVHYPVELTSVQAKFISPSWQLHPLNLKLLSLLLSILPLLLRQDQLLAVTSRLPLTTERHVVEIWQSKLKPPLLESWAADLLALANQAPLVESRRVLLHRHRLEVLVADDRASPVEVDGDEVDRGVVGLRW